MSWKKEEGVKVTKNVTYEVKYVGSTYMKNRSKDIYLDTYVRSGAEAFAYDNSHDIEWPHNPQLPWVPSKETHAL